MHDQQEQPFTPEMVEKILAIAGEEAVLVGGQALAFWVNYYAVPLPSPPPRNHFFAISRDTDFLGGRQLVDTIQSGVKGGKAYMMPRSAISSLIGTVKIPLSDTTYASVDVIDNVAGLKREAVEKHAIEIVHESGLRFKVLHPMDVLFSRVYNHYKFTDKQTENGRLQTYLSLEVVHCYIRDTANIPEQGDKAAMRQIEQVVDLAKSAQGRFAKMHGADFFRAIPVESIRSVDFQTKRWPRMIDEIISAMPQKYNQPNRKNSSDSDLDM